MSDPNVLNLDDLVNEVKKVKLDGVEHLQQETTVEGYIERVQKNKSRDASVPVDVQVSEACELLHDMFPTLTTERLRKLSLNQLNHLIQFSLAAPQDIAERVTKQHQASEAQATGNG